MSTDLPLHVQVAEALGWTDFSIKEGEWWGTEPHAKMRIPVARYDLSFCSAGPLIQRFGISLICLAEHESKVWEAECNFQVSPAVLTPCEAVSRLVVLLKKEGKLHV